MKKILSGLLAIFVLTFSFSAYAEGEDSVLPVTKDYMEDLYGYGISYIPVGNMVMLEEYVDNIDVPYTLFVLFDEANTVTFFSQVVQTEPEKNGEAQNVCAYINDWYEIRLCEVSQEGYVSFYYTQDLTKYEPQDRGLAALSTTLTFTDIIEGAAPLFRDILIKTQPEGEESSRAAFDTAKDAEPTVESMPASAAGSTSEPTMESMSEPTAEPTKAPRPTSTPVPDSAIVEAAERVYELSKTIWPDAFLLAKEAGVPFARNIQVASIELGRRRTSSATVLFKGTFSGYDAYGMFQGRYRFTAEVPCTIDGSFVSADIAMAEYTVEEA